jgi:hypothetical protein
MEESIQSLEVVCKHLRNECGDDTILSLRRRLNNAHVSNHRLRKKALQLSEQIAVERSCRAILTELLANIVKRMDFATISE